MITSFRVECFIDGAWKVFGTYERSSDALIGCGRARQIGYLETRILYTGKYLSVFA